MRHHLVFCMFATLVVAAPRPARAQSDPAVAATAGSERTVLDGVYTTAQAGRGAQAFRENCATCHFESQFADPSFLRGWSGRSVRDLFERLRTTMPYDNPGRLERQQYTDIIAYFLSMGELPAGAVELPADDAALRRIRIVPRDDPGRR